MQITVVDVLHLRARGQSRNQFANCCWSLTTGISGRWEKAICSEQPATWLVSLSFLCSKRFHSSSVQIIVLVFVHEYLLINNNLFSLSKWSLYWACNIKSCRIWYASYLADITAFLFNQLVSKTVSNVCMNENSSSTAV